MPKSIAHVWIFASDSNPDKTYETLQYEDRSTSCSCPGWTRRVNIIGERTCKHVRAVHLGVADSQAVTHAGHTSNSAYFQTPPTTPTKGKHATKKTKAEQSTFGSFGGRTIIK